MNYRTWKTLSDIQSQYEKNLTYISYLFRKIAISSGSDKAKYQREMRNFQNSDHWDKYIASICRQMVWPLAKGNYDKWLKALKNKKRLVKPKSKIIYGSLIAELNEGLEADIEDQILANARLIKTLPLDTAEKVLHDIESAYYQGIRASEIENIIRSKTQQHSQASVRLIARTEVSKTATALTRARSENLGLQWYVWRTMQDGKRVRPSHRIMEGVLINWNDPPSPEKLANEEYQHGTYHAGCIWNCRCYSEPLVDVDLIQWPHKIYLGGKIISVSKAKFKSLSGM